MAANYQIYRPEWRGWKPGERESFFAAIEQHRRAAWRVTLVSVFANVAMAVALSVLVAPLFYSVVILLLDLVNLVTPMPNLVDGVYRVIDPILDSPTAPTIVDWLRFMFWASLPGLFWFGCVLLGLRRMLRISGLFDVREVPARMPNPYVLAEQRLANVIMEMSIAASLPLPRVLIAPRATLNAAVLGSDPEHATIVISQGLLSRLDRDELQGVAAHLISCIANGDMRIGLRAAQTLALFAIFARISSIVIDGRGASRRLLRILRALSFPTAASARALYDELGDPLAPREEPSERPKRDNSVLGKLRVVLLAALWGPVAIAGFFGGYVGTFLLGPLLAIAWRRRKYMADATAVRLTRDPDTLGQALQKIAAGGSRATLAPTVAHLSVVQPDSGTDGILGGVVPMFPSLARRLRALATLGAHLDREPARLPLRTVVILTAGISAMAPLVLFVVAALAYLSLAISLFATGMTVGLAHVTLRWLGSFLA
jgi:Zn-dependent protease with chaperone function